MPALPSPRGKNEKESACERERARERERFRLVYACFLETRGKPVRDDK